MAVIDWGFGNLFSISWALRKAGLNVEINSSAENLKNADGIVLPGVGNFKTGLRNLQDVKQDVTRMVEDGIPLFGVCLGMQLLFEKSEESPGEGLGLLKGKVLRLPGHVKIPHMGWNKLTLVKPSMLLDGISEADHFYFVHSYYGCPADGAVVAAKTEYGLSFPSVVASDNIYGTQFHPEKSGEPGERVIGNFAGFVKK